MPFVAVPPGSTDFLRDLSAQLDLPPAEPARLLETGPSGLAYWNCHDYVCRYGGRILFGWQVLAWPGIYLELLHHTVVEDADGNYVDPTTCVAAHAGQSVFIEDRQAILSRRTPPPIASRIYAYSGDAAAIGQAVKEAKARLFEIKRDLARIIQESGPAPTPVLTDYPWPRSPDIVAMLEELNRSGTAIEEIHARCAAWDLRQSPRCMQRLTMPAIDRTVDAARRPALHP